MTGDGTGMLDWRPVSERYLMDLHRILQELRAERDRLTAAIEALEGKQTRPASASTTRRARIGRPRKHRLTAAGRRRLSEMMKRRWAERRKKASRAA